MDMLELYRVMKLQDFISSIEFRIENEWKVDETEPNWTLWGKNQKCIKSKNLGFDPALVWTQKN